MVLMVDLVLLHYTVCSCVHAVLYLAIAAIGYILQMSAIVLDLSSSRCHPPDVSSWSDHPATHSEWSLSW